MSKVRSVRPRMYCRHRGLQFEQLESRYLLAGDTYLVNFQLADAPVPTRYLPDAGEVFDVRTSGLSYGWSSDHTDQARDRNLVSEQRLDTLIHFEVGQYWEFQLPNGSYQVTVSVGDPANNDGLHTINVEGVSYWNSAPDTNGAMTMSKMVTVSDGRLTIDQGAAADKATRIDYVHIVGISDGSGSSPVAPTITEPSVDGQTVNPSDVHMEAIGFFDADGNTHRSTDWEIWTVGVGAEPVWQTLGIQGVERLHTHLGDGVFINSRAGQIALAGNANYELRVRFRDDTGAVSSYATRTFHTGSASTTFPLEMEDVLPTPAPSWTLVSGEDVDLPFGPGLLVPGGLIIAIDLDGDSSSPAAETSANAVDRTPAKYLNFGETNSGFIVTPSVGATIVDGFQITTANDAEVRDPTAWLLYGTNDTITSGNNSTGSQENWTLIGSGTVSLPSARNTIGPLVNVNNATAYTSYRMVFTGVKNAASANSMQFAEIQFYGDPVVDPSPPLLRLEHGSTGEVLLSIIGQDGVGNDVIDAPALAAHGAIRVVIEAGGRNLSLGRSNLVVIEDSGRTQTLYLPQIDLAAGERLDLWVSSSGGTYFGTQLQTEPNFNSLARSADLSIPFIATKANFVIEEVGSGYRLPVNITFVPDPGPNPDDPLYYVTELYGSIQVVTRDGTKHEFATGLLDYNPQGPISGSGEQGLSGIAVRRDAANPDIYHLYVGMLWDNGSPAGGAAHYPKVERIDSVSGGLAMGARTVLLNMQPETQGQSHQISNITMGPDGKLYVHNGDGFDASTAQNLNQYRGKILRLNLDGSAPTDNPFYNVRDGITARDYVYAYGFRNPFGGAWRASDGKHYEVENGPSVDRFAQVNAGVNYNWNGSNASMMTNAIYNWDPSHAPVNITFVQQETFNGSGFPAAMRDHAFVSESGPTYATGAQTHGKRIVEFALSADGSLLTGPDSLVEYVGEGQSTVVGLAAGPDGLYFTELYEETGNGGPTGVGARIFRVRYINPLAGDYDIDGNVDRDDYAVWKQSFGSNLLLAADGNGNGVVDAADYTVWRDNLGTTLPASAGAGVAAVVSAMSEAVVQSPALKPDAVLTESTVGLWPTVSIDSALKDLFPARSTTVKMRYTVCWPLSPGIAHVDNLLSLVRAARGGERTNPSHGELFDDAPHSTRFEMTSSHDEVFAELELAYRGRR